MGGVTAQFHGRVFPRVRVVGKLVPDNRPRENPSMREILNTEGYLREKVQGNLRGRSRSYSSILLYILVSMPVKIPGHGTAGTAHTGTGTSRVSPSPGKYPAVELGILHTVPRKILGHGTGGRRGGVRRRSFRRRGVGSPENEGSHFSKNKIIRVTHQIVTVTVSNESCNVCYKL